MRKSCSACTAAMCSMPCSKSVQGEPASCTTLSADTPSSRSEYACPAVRFIVLDLRLQHTKAFYMFMCCCRLSSVRTAATATMRATMTMMLLRESSSW